MSPQPPPLPPRRDGSATPRPRHPSATHATIELGELLRQFELDLVLLTNTTAENTGGRAPLGGPGSDSTLTLPVQWVHSSDMLNPTPFLTPRTVLLTTGTQFAEDPTAEVAEAYVSRLNRAGVTALGFGVGIRWELIPHALVTAAERLSLPLFRVPYQTPFLAIAQTAARLLNAQGHARDTWALESQRTVANAAVQRDGLAAVVREAANRLGRWVAVADRTGRTVEFAPRSARPEIGADWIRRETRELVERGGRASRIRAHGDVQIELQTLGRSGHLLGALITPSGVGDHAERMLLGLIAAIATVQFQHRAGRGNAETALRTAVLRLLLAGEIGLAEQVAVGVLPRLPRGRVNVVRLGPVDGLPSALIDDLRSLAATPGLLTAPLDDGAALVCESPQLTAVRRALATGRCPAGISERGVVEELAPLLEQAETARRRAETTDATGPVDYRPDMHGGVLRLLDAQPESRRLAESMLAPIRQHDRRHGDRIEHSLAIWLAHHGQTSPAAEELGVHRHTLRGRMQTVERLLLCELDDPDTRAELWAALRYSADAATP